MLKKSLFVMTAILLIAQLVNAQVPQLINYQGVLINPATGQPISDNTYTITFSIYDAASGGSAIWAESQSVTTKNGLYSVLLGSTAPLTPTILGGTEKYLGIKVGSDPEMAPRKRIVSVAYAIVSEDANKVDGKDASAFIEKVNTNVTPLNGNIDLVPGSNITITPGDHNLTIAASGGGGGTVTQVNTGSGLTGGPITTSGTISIATEGVTTAMLQNSAVTSGKIADNTITAADLATSSVTADEIADATVTATDIAGAQVVKSLNTLKDDVTLVAGSNITITPSGNALKIAASSGGDNLGNHTATQNIQLNGNWLSGDGGDEGVQVNSDGNVGIGTSSQLNTRVVISGPLYSQQYPYNVEIADEATASQDVGGGIAFSGLADLKRAFSAIHGGHESATAAQYAGYLRFLTRINGEAQLRERMRISSTGNVGIGDTSPTNTLDVAGKIGINDQQVIYLPDQTDFEGTLYLGDGGASLSHIAGSEGRYNSAMGIGALIANTKGFGNTANGYGSLHFNTEGFANTAYGSYALLNITTQDNNTAVGYYAGASSVTFSNGTFLGAYAFPTADGYDNVMALGCNARPTASNQVRIGNSSVTSIGGYADWTNFSDGRYKLAVRENVKGLDFIMKLRPVTYQLDANRLAVDLKEDQRRDEQGNMTTESSAEDINARHDKSQIVYTGFIGQEVEQAAKEIGFDFSGVDAPKNEHDFYGLRYAEFVVPLVKAMQEQQKIIEDMRNEIAALKKRLGE